MTTSGGLGRGGGGGGKQRTLALKSLAVKETLFELLENLRGNKCVRGSAANPFSPT